MAENRGSDIVLGRVAGTRVVLKRSWLLIAAVLTFLLGPTVQSYVPSLSTGATYLVAFGFALLLLVSVFLHELAHAVTAKAVGTPPTEIVLDLWGGHTAFDRESPSPGRTVLVAAVGPATNGVIAVVAWLAWQTTTPGSVAEVLTLLLWTSNGFVAVLNALPGLPLDGGRVLEGLVWALSRSRTTGTVVAGWCGRVVALGIVGWLVVRPVAEGRQLSIITAVWVGAIAWMLWQGATQSIRYATWRRVAGTLVAGRLMTPAATLPTDANVADALALPLPRTGPDRPVAVVLVDGTGRPLAVLDDEAVASVPADRAAVTPVTAVARLLPELVLPAASSGEELVERLRSAQAPEYAVADGGRVVGVLTWRAVVAAVSAR